MNRKTLRISAALVIGLCLLLFFVYRFYMERQNYAQISPQTGEITEAVYGLGRVKSNHRYEVKVGVLSHIKKIFVKEGDFVQKGQKLIELAEGISFSAPFTGVVTLVSVYEGETAVAQTVLVRVEDLKDRHIELSLEQEGALRVKQGQSAKVSFESLRGEVLTGHVVGIFPRDNEFIANVEIGSLKESILPGMTADVSIEVGKIKGTMIPLKALRNGIVTVLRNGRPQKIKVEVGLVDGLSAEIKDGSLQPEDKVLVPKDE